MDSKEPEELSWVKSKHRTQNGGQKKIVLGGPKENEARKVFLGFSYLPPREGAGSGFNPPKGRGKDQKGNGKEGAYPQSRLSVSETLSEEGYGHAWESDDWFSSLTDDSSTSAAGWSCSRDKTAWMASVPSNLAHHPTHVVVDLGCCTLSIGSRTAIKRFQKYALCCDITTEFCPCKKSFLFDNSETETCWECCIIHFPTTPPCSARVDVLETGDVPILFSLS